MREKGEGKKGEAFTRIALSTNTLRTKGEEVKAKNEKQRTRAYACALALFWVIRCLTARRFRHKPPFEGLG